MQVKLKERVVSALANTETVPTPDWIEPLKEGEVAIGTVPLAAQGLFALGAEYLNDMKMMLRDSEGEKNPNMTAWNRLDTVAKGLRMLFWGLINEEFAPDGNKSLAIRKDWQVIETPAPQKQSDTFGLDGLTVILMR